MSNNLATVDKLNPFVFMQIDDTSILNKLEGRNPCPVCGKSRKFFCYTCYVPIKELEHLLPTLKLPIKIDIIKHKNEIDGKSTAVHAAILAPDDVKIYTYPDLPSYEENEKIVLIFPSATAVDVSNLFNEVEDSGDNFDLPKGHHVGTLLRKPLAKTKKHNLESRDSYKNQKDLPITRALFIDSTWNQSRGIYKDLRIKNLKCVVLQNRLSQFWRHQKGSPRWYLATIEAIHQFLVEVHLNAWGLDKHYKGLACLRNDVDYNDKLIPNSNNETIVPYNGQYDNLLFFFSHMYDLIHTLYDHDQLKSYKRPIF